MIDTRITAGSPRPTNFRVNLEVFRGPLDLLLYLVRKHELEVTDIPIALITHQYLDYIAALEEKDVNSVGDFLELASTLIEIKSRVILPREDLQEEQFEDPREELVHRLLEYKRYKDVASMLEERSRDQQQAFARLSNDLPPRQTPPSEQPIHDVELWDLVSAYGRIARQNEPARESTIIYDDTPIEVYMQQIHRRLVEDGCMAISDAFESGMHKTAVIGMLLAVLELVRHHSAEAEQPDEHGEIWIRPGPHFNEILELAGVDNYEGDTTDEDAQPTKHAE